jgi:hypothetical protein
LLFDFLLRLYQLSSQIIPAACTIILPATQVARTKSAGEV